MDDRTLARIARALAHPARVHIVRLLASQTECRGAELFADLPLAQSTVSEHLSVLRRAGIVSSRQVGVASVYCLSVDVLRAFTEELGGLVEAAGPCAPEVRGCR